MIWIIILCSSLIYLIGVFLLVSWLYKHSWHTAGGDSLQKSSDNSNLSHEPSIDVHHPITRLPPCNVTDHFRIISTSRHSVYFPICRCCLWTALLNALPHTASSQCPARLKFALWAISVVVTGTTGRWVALLQMERCGAVSWFRGIRDFWRWDWLFADRKRFWRQFLPEAYFGPKARLPIDCEVFDRYSYVVQQQVGSCIGTRCPARRAHPIIEISCWYPHEYPVPGSSFT